MRSCPGFHEGNGEVCTHFALVSMSFVHDFTIEQGLNFKLVNPNFGKKFPVYARISISSLSVFNKNLFCRILQPMCTVTFKAFVSYF